MANTPKPGRSQRTLEVLGGIGHLYFDTLNAGNTTLETSGTLLNVDFIAVGGNATIQVQNSSGGVEETLTIRENINRAWTPRAEWTDVSFVRTAGTVDVFVETAT